MARSIRIIFENGIYHVYNRGNYRAPIFATPGAKDVFLDCLFKAAREYGWVIHAFVILDNHFHIALQIPRANLPESVAWLETTFAARFNRFRSENGHVFQGRYHARLVEEGAYLSRLVNYIHLNPVKAGIVPLEGLPRYKWSSLNWFLSKVRPEFLVCSDWLSDLHLSDQPADWVSYMALLGTISGSPALQKEHGFADMMKGWAIGSAEWKREIATQERTPARLSAPFGPQRDALREAHWKATLEQLLVAALKTPADAASARKSASWKVKIAADLRCTCNAPYRWIARELSMGTPASVRGYVFNLRRL